LERDKLPFSVEAACWTLCALIPGTTLALFVKRDEFAFVDGMAPVTIGLLLSSATVLAAPLATQPAAWLLIAATAVLSVTTKISPVRLIADGALVGAMGWIDCGHFVGSALPVMRAESKSHSTVLSATEGAPHARHQQRPNHHPEADS
jgi:chromate transport protein ChrA